MGFAYEDSHPEDGPYCSDLSHFGGEIIINKDDFINLMSTILNSDKEPVDWEEIERR